MLTTQPTLKISFGLGSSMEASCWVARKIFLSPAIASSNARTLDSRPTTNGVIMYGKMTTSRMGIIGRRFVSDFSFEVSITLPRGFCSLPPGLQVRRELYDWGFPAGLAGLF